MYWFFFSIVFLPCNALAQATDLCDILRISNCRGITRQLRRTSAASLPSTTTAASMNPANVTFDRGLGLDTIYQPKNSLLFGLTTGTGKMGGALVNGSIENSFFGNRAPEEILHQIEREGNSQQFRNKKISLALGARLISNKKVGLDIGVIVKRHPEIKKINPGIGLSGRVWKLSFGASVYKDDYFIDLTKGLTPTGTPYAEKNRKESFTVTTYTVGTRIQNLALDYGLINTSKLDIYEESTKISILSSSYHFNDFLISFALRKEHSSAPVINQRIAEMEINKSATYGGFQYSINSNIIIGIQYNYFLMKEASFSATLFI